VTRNPLGEQGALLAYIVKVVASDAEDVSQLKHMTRRSILSLPSVLAHFSSDGEVGLTTVDHLLRDNR
jgi:hypothetical protein